MDNFYVVELKLQNGFVTTRNKKIDPKAAISGMAEFKTSDKSIMERIFNSFYGRMNTDY